MKSRKLAVKQVRPASSSQVFSIGGRGNHIRSVTSSKQCITKTYNRKRPSISCCQSHTAAKLSTNQLAAGGLAPPSSYSAALPDRVGPIVRPLRFQLVLQSSS